MATDFCQRKWPNGKNGHVKKVFEHSIPLKPVHLNYTELNKRLFLNRTIVYISKVRPVKLFYCFISLQNVKLFYAIRQKQE